MREGQLSKASIQNPNHGWRAAELNEEKIKKGPTNLLAEIRQGKIGLKGWME